MHPHTVTKRKPNNQKIYIFFILSAAQFNKPNRLVWSVALMDICFINVDVEITYITKRETTDDIILLNSAHYHTYITIKYCIYRTPRHTKLLTQRPY
jgi:hypothetical protein